MGRQKAISEQTPTTFKLSVIMVKEEGEALQRIRPIMAKLGMPLVDLLLSIIWSESMLVAASGPKAMGYSLEMIGLKVRNDVEVPGEWPIFRLGDLTIHLWRQRVFYEGTGIWEPSSLDLISPTDTRVPCVEALWLPEQNRISISDKETGHLSIKQIGKLRAGYDYLIEPAKRGRQPRGELSPSELEIISKRFWDYVDDYEERPSKKAVAQMIGMSPRNFYRFKLKWPPSIPPKDEI